MLCEFTVLKRFLNRRREKRLGVGLPKAEKVRSKLGMLGPAAGVQQLA